MITFDTSILLSYYQSRNGGMGTAAASTGTGATASKYAPTPPWDSKAVAPRADALVKSAMLGRKFIDESSAQLDLPGASADYRKLFALYQGLNTLHGLAERMDAKGVTEMEQGRITKTFAKGMAETAAYIDLIKLEQLRVTRGEAVNSAKTAVGVPRTKPEYTTAPIHTGNSGAPVAAFQGDVQFNISVKRLTVTHNIAIDLDDLGSQPRTMSNVILHINAKLEAAGLTTRFATHRIPGEPRTTQVGGKTVTLGPGEDSWALKIKGDTGETVSFSAQATAPAVYLAQGAGNPDPDKKADTDDDATVRQFLKIQTETGSTPGALAEQGATYRMDGQVFARTLGPEVEAVRSTQVGADGSVFMLADVSAAIDGQEIKGQQDVALLKYDSAGKLIFARTLGAAETAGGMAMALSADGKIAIAGTVSGGLIEGSEGLTKDTADSFVTLFNADGEEIWTQRRGGLKEDEASAVAFGADGTVYVAGRAKSSMPGASAIGGWDGYLQGITTNAKNEPVSLFTRQFGTAGDDKVSGIVVDGTSVVLAGVENGRGVLRRYDNANTSAPTLAATRDIGSIQGDIAGIALDGGQVVIAGSTRNAALSAGTITHNHAGGTDAFAARLSADLTAGGGDAIAYFGGTGDDRATALTVANGQVWLAGGAGTDLPGLTPVGDKDGFIARLNIGTGAVDWSRRFTGKDKQAAPTAIAVDTSGASALDRMGLPKGTLDWTDSQLITAVSSARAGDQFQVRTSARGTPKTVTIEAKDTLETLAAKVRRALGFQGKVDIVAEGAIKHLVEGKMEDSDNGGYRRLQIKPQSDRATIEILPGKGGRDVLEALGLAEGMVRTVKAGENDGKAYGLKLDRDLDIGSKAGIKAAMDGLSAALGVIRTAYRDLETAQKPKSATAASGPVPAYLTNQLANYQAALDRLGGG